ncbi:MAG: FAD:protein FMN transferase [Clostridiales bacterium]|nr:FAD:protein FMN transferase [Clostridiales bacterium]
MIGKKLQQPICIFLCFVIFLTILTSCTDTREIKTSKSAFVLNTIATITIYGMTNEKILDECFNLCRHYESLFSRTDENSEIYKLNARKISVVSDETAELISKGLYFSKLSGGKFDITIEPLSSLWNFSSDSPAVPEQSAIDDALRHVGYKSVTVSGNTVAFDDEYTRLDLGAIAKGYIADKLKDYLISQGVEKAIINLGGNVLCIGGKTSSRGFEIGIQRPFGDGAIAAVSVSDMSVVTSGVYERYFSENGKRYHHILNPKTGYPYENGLLSVTIVGKNSCDCDALSTLCFALGMDDGLQLINSMDGFYALFITDDYKLHFSEGAEKVLHAVY